MKYKVVILFLCCLLSAAAQATELPGPVTVAADTVPDKNTLRRILDWVGIFSLYSDVDISSKVDLKQYGEAADLGAALLTNAELRDAVANFKAETFINVYPYGLVKSDEWIFKKLNEVTRLQYDVQNAPYLTLEVYFEPVNNGAGYSITPIFTGSPEIKVRFDSINSRLRAALPKTYGTIRDAKADVNAAIIGVFQDLQKTLGDLYAPNVALRYKDDLYTDGQSLEVWQQAGGGAMFEAVDRKGDLLPAGKVSWGFYKGASTNKALIPLNKAMDTTITAFGNGGTVMVKVKVKPFTLDVEDLLKEVLVEVLTEKIQNARDRINSVGTDSTDVNKQISAVRAQLDRESGIAAFANVTPSADAVMDNAPDMVEGTAEELAAIKANVTNNNYIEYHRKKFALLAEFLLQIKVEILLKDIIQNDGSLNAYVRAIKENSPDLVADLVVNMLAKPEKRVQLKDVIVKFLNEQIDEVVSRS